MATITKGKVDDTTHVNISIIFYYTDLFERETPDIKGHIDHIVENANLAYMNSKIPLELKCHCMVKMPYEEVPQQESKERLRQFKAAQSA